MSPINFDALQVKYPDYAPVWEALRRWFATNSPKRYVELAVLLRALSQVEAPDLVLALDAMIESGMLKTAYRVKAPGGYLLEGEYEEPDQIPAKLPDRDYSHFIRRGEGDLVSGYRWEPTDAA
jgi:hypothetical protein